MNTCASSGPRTSFQEILRRVGCWLGGETADQLDQIGVSPPLSTSAPVTVIVIDASGSMLTKDWPPSRLDAAKGAAKAYCTQREVVDPSSSVAIVAFGCRGSKRCGLTPVTSEKVLRAAIDGIGDLGSTNMAEGLACTERLFGHRRGMAEVIFLSDGHCTGRSPLPVAERLKRSGVCINCIGIGAEPADVDEGLLRAIASERTDRGKRYRWIGDGEQLVRHFEELAGRITRA